MMMYYLREHQLQQSSIAMKIVYLLDSLHESAPIRKKDFAEFWLSNEVNGFRRVEDRHR
jgi:hypothetical protein